MPLQDNTPREVWGSMVGPADNNQNAPYNNCILAAPGNNFQGCNESRVNGDHVISVEFVESDEVTNAAPIALIRPVTAGGAGGALAQRLGVRDPSQIRTGANQRATVTFTWEDICRFLTNGTTAAVVTGPGINECQIGGAAVSGTIIVTIGFESGPTSIDTTSTSTLNFYIYRPDPNSYDNRSTNSSSSYLTLIDSWTCCLLYTSPSPRDQRGSRMPSSA